MKENNEELLEEKKAEPVFENKMKSVLNSEQEMANRSLQEILDHDEYHKEEKEEKRKERNALLLDEGRRRVMSYMPEPRTKVSGDIDQKYTKIPDTLANMIQEIREDKSYGPRFKKVRAAAEAYAEIKFKEHKIRNANGSGGRSSRIPSDKDAAKALAALYTAAVEYLMERKTGSKKKRKEMCEALCYQIEENFVESCNSTYLSAFHDSLSAKNKEYFDKKEAARKDGEEEKENLYRKHLSNMNDTLERQYGTSVFKEVLAFRKENDERKEINRSAKKEKKKLIPTASDIKRMVDSLETMKKFNLPRYKKPGNNNDPAEFEKAKNDYERELSGSALMLTVSYNKLIETVQSYLAYAESKNSEPLKMKAEQDETLKKIGNYGRKRGKGVTIPFETAKYNELLTALKSEMYTINNCITEFSAQNIEKIEKNDLDLTWEKALSERNKVNIHIEENTKDVGAGTSSVFKIKRDDDRVQYIKQEEIVKENLFVVWDDLFKEIKEKKGYKPEYQPLLDELDKLMNDKIFEKVKKTSGKELDKAEGYTYLTFVGASHGYKGLRNSYDVNIFYDCMDQNVNRKIIEKALSDAHADGALYDWLMDNLREDTDEEKKEFFGNILMELTKKINSNYFSHNSLGMNPGQSLSNRDVATSRLAELLNMSELVPKSEMAKVDHKGKEKIELVMDQAKGYDIDTDEVKDLKYSKKGITAVLKVMLHDNISGQVDRNRGNYLVTTGYGELEEGEVFADEYIDGIQLIDNDLSFGSQTASSIHQKIERKVPLDIDAVKALPQETRDLILSIKPEELDIFFTDLLDSKSLYALKDRFSAVQRLTKTADDQLKNGLKDKDEDVRFHNYLMINSEEYRTTWYIQSIKQREETEGNYMIDNNTYFDSDHLDLSNLDLKLADIKFEWRDRFKEADNK